MRDLAVTARLQALAGLHDERAGPLADIILAAPGQHDGNCVAAARLTRALISWDGGQITAGLELLRDAVRHSSGICPDARQVQPLLMLAAVLTDVRDLAGADRLLEAADHPALPGVPAQAALAIVRARIHLARGRLPEAGAAGQAALAVAQDLSAYGYAATAHSVLSVIELRRGDIAAAARHLACRAPIGPQFADFYARPETLVAEAQVTEARDGPAAARAHLRRLGAGLQARPGLLLGDPGLAAWLARSALAAGDGELAVRAARAAQALAVAHDPGFPALAAGAAHSRGLARRDPACLAEAARQYPDPWAGASATEDLGVLHGSRGDRDQAIRHLKEALGGYRQVGRRARRGPRPAAPAQAWHPPPPLEHACGPARRGLGQPDPN